MENGTKTFEKIIIDTISSIWKNSERTDIYSIFKALVKNNATNLDIHSLEKEVKNMEENGILGQTHFYTRKDLVMIMTPQEMN